MCAFPVTVSRHSCGNGCLWRRKSFGPSAPQQPTWNRHIIANSIRLLFLSNMTYVLLQERQGFPAGNVIRGHNKPADGMLQNRLDTGVCCTVVQQQSSSHYAEYKGKDLRTHKLKNYNYYLSNIVVLLQLTISRVTGFSIKALQQPRKEVTMTITAIPIRM